jgi:hypothetical protein
MPRVRNNQGLPLSLPEGKMLTVLLAKFRPTPYGQKRQKHETFKLMELYNILHKRKHFQSTQSETRRS